MKIVEYWEWRLHDELHPTRTRKARWRMTDEDAFALDPKAIRIEGSGIARAIPETEEEHAFNTRAGCVAQPEYAEILAPRRKRFEEACAAAWEKYLAAGGTCKPK